MTRIPTSDLFALANGPWIAETPLPADRGIYGSFHILRDLSEENVRDIIATSPSRGGRLFRSFMDTAGREEVGITPLLPLFDAYTTARTPLEIISLSGKYFREGCPAAFSGYVGKDANSEIVRFWLHQSGLGLPDEAYYREDHHKDALHKYEEHLARMLAFIPERYLDGRTCADAAHEIVLLETALASGHLTVVESRDADKTYNPVPFHDLPEATRVFLEAAGADSETIIVSSFSYLEHVESLLTDDMLPAWRLWALWGVLRAFSSLLTEEIFQEHFAFYQRTLLGTEQPLPLWRRAVGFADSYVAEEIGHEYVDRFFAPSAKKHMLTLVDYLLDAYRERIESLPWMTAATKDKALAKLGTFVAKIGYPDTWRDFSGLEPTEHGRDLVGNARVSACFEHDYEMKKLGLPADRSEWLCPPQMVNAFYYPVQNDITFPAAILQPPFFDKDVDAAFNFGAIGAVIGHEIGHGFDDQGSKYDGSGALNFWWTQEDRAAFEALTSRLVDQFNGRVPRALAQAYAEEGEDSEKPGVNGAFTLGENIGDLGGLGIAVVAYRRYLADQGLTFDTAPCVALNERQEKGVDPSLKGLKLTGLQRLFLSWALVWRTKARPELEKQMLAVDPHSPAEFRCNIISANIDEFYEAFEMPEDAPFYLAPEDRVHIW